MLVNYGVNQAKSQFFDQKSVYEQLDRDTRRGLSKWGAYVRRAVKSSLRKARQKSLSELTQKERQRFRIRQSIAKRDGLPRPKRPLAPSAPGEPPRMKSGEIKKFLFFGFDEESRSVVVGPAVLNTPTGAPENMEEGGFITTKNGRVRVAKRPYMKPQFDKFYPQLPRFLAGS